MHVRTILWIIVICLALGLGVGFWLAEERGSQVGEPEAPGVESPPAPPPAEEGPDKPFLGQ